MDFSEAGWDARYEEKDRIWSGDPNPVLVTEVAGLTRSTGMTGSVLDVGCGEGGDAVWLAELGWRVTGADISSVALGRAAAAAEARGLSVQWQHVDLLVSPPAADSYDLVSAHFMQLPPDTRASLHRRLAASVAPGGTLLVVAHNPADALTRGHADRLEMFFTPEDVLADIGPGWAVDVAEVRPRQGRHPGGAEETFHDTVVRVRRPDRGV